MKSLRLLLVIAISAAFSLSAAAQPCPASCPTLTQDEIAVQAALDAAGLDGGGVVQLEPRVYLTCGPLIVPSNVTLRGSGRGATVIRGSQIYYERFVSGTGAAGTLSSIGSENVTIRDLTVDHFTCSRNSNGIALVPTGSDDPVRNALIENTEILGAPYYHSYMIWNLKGKYVKIVNNWVNGNQLTGTSPQEGIESFGGNDVLIAGNTVRNIGYACLNIGSAGLPNSGTYNVRAVNNHLVNCNVGVNLGTSMAPSGLPQNQTHTKVAWNTIISPRQTGIDVAVTPGTVERDLLIEGNTIKDLYGTSPVGIWLRANGGPITSASVVSTVISGNHIENVRGTNANGIRLSGYFNTRLLGNAIIGVDSSAIYCFDSSDIEFSGNRIEDGGASAIQFWKATAPMERISVDDNRVHWNGTSSAIMMIQITKGTVRNNVLTRTDSSQPTPINVTGTCGTPVTGNVPWYQPNWSGVTTPACP